MTKEETPKAGRNKRHFTPTQIREAKRVQVEGSNALLPTCGCTEKGVRIPQYGSQPVPFRYIVDIEQ